jgi:tetraacyldisaccharide 4'-kinase
VSGRSIEDLWGGNAVSSRLARVALSPASWAFAAATGLRNLLYDARLLTAEHVDLPVVCVGNLRVGGSGKTPLVMWLVEQLRDRGRRPVVVSRGYGAAPAKLVVVAAPLPVTVPAGVIALDANAPAGRDAGDEAVLVARRMGVPVVCGADRVAACRTASAVFGADIIVLDDGFQHRRLYRDLDLVIVDSADRDARLLPAGPLRERPSALERADFVIDTGCAAEPGCITMVGAPEALVRAVGREVDREPLGRLRGARVVAVAGIAKPERFVGALEALGAEVVWVELFDDHHSYSAEDWDRVKEMAASADLVVTTEKDLVKLEAFVEDDGFAARLFALRHGVALMGGDAILERIAQFDASEMSPHHPDSDESTGAA